MVFYEKIQHQRLGDILVTNELITEGQLKEALGKQKEFGLRLGSTLIKLDFLTQDDINWVLHEQFNIPQISLTKDMVDIDLIPLIPKEIFKDYNILPLAKSGNELTVCVADPTDFETLKKLEKVTGFNLNVCISEVETIKKIITDITLIVSGEKEKAKTQLELVAEPIPREMLLKLVEDPSGNLFFDFVFNTVVSKNLDSLSIIPFEKHFFIYFYFLGRNFKKFELPIQFFSAISKKAKEMWSINENPQLNHLYKIKYPIEKDMLDFKLLFFETFFGNAIKIFRNRKIERFVPLNKQGFSREQIDLIFSNLILEHGTYFLIGKEPEISYNIMTSILGEFSSLSKKIALFNNFEYIDIEGIINLQDQFDPDKDEELPLNLIKMIRPDVICFSELKTPKQLQQAIQLGYSGKIVLAFYKERDIFHFLTSLYKLELDTFTLKNSVKLVIHHEKVEELCSNCKRAFSPNMDYLTIFQNFKIEETDFNRKVGCKECLGFGYANLLDIYEVFKIDPFVRINMDNLDTFQKMLKEFKAQGYVGTKTKILSQIASGSIPFNSIIDIF